ncbi:hypothetical protein SNE510_20380 [Streptomyces sp. NE5-10]|uniref:DUF6397 family protein n=1 Tax=Streptomyces sp. NE5-10 TaxID=2759674 RepID=UPI00190350BC|nr:DUF6397 family protein [Streptomyces sp. NE5-10]GHJ92519.1 hypothetical protein SNE510_20380 [Streptomyces sp. NE5-10]
MTVDAMTVDGTTRTVTPARAAAELELKREEFRLAVRMGLIRTAPLPDRDEAVREGGGRERAPERRPVERAELDRLKAAPDFPDGLRERVRAVGAKEAAGLLSITPDRFARLARTGHLSPVRFYLNRYRSVIWLYVAAEVAAFGEEHPALLGGRLPAEVREREAAGEDLRARNWRSRHLALLLRGTDDPWVRAAAVASLLDPVQVAEVVDDPYERSHLDRLRPPPPPGFPVSGAAYEVAERFVRADDPDEILWHRVSLALALDEARAARQAPHPGERPRPAAPAATEPEVVPQPVSGAGRVPVPVPDAAGGPVRRPAVRARARRGAPSPGRAPARAPGARPGLLDRLRRSLPGRTGGGGGWGERRDWV